MQFSYLLRYVSMMVRFGLLIEFFHDLSTHFFFSKHTSCARKFPASPPPVIPRILSFMFAYAFISLFHPLKQHTFSNEMDSCAKSNVFNNSNYFHFHFSTCPRLGPAVPFLNANCVRMRYFTSSLGTDHHPRGLLRREQLSNCCMAATQSFVRAGLRFGVGRRKWW